MKQKEYSITTDQCEHFCSSICFDKPDQTQHPEFTLPPVPFYFMRHGETEWNQKSLIQGCIDISLNEKGIEQAHLAAEMLKGIAIGTIISSPLQRALTTAEIIAAALGKSITVIDEFKNACYGVIEGKSKGEHHAAYTGWKTGYMTQGAECYPCFKQRVYKGFEKALQYPGPVLIIAHGGVHWPLQDALKLDPYTVPNATPLAHIPPTQQHDRWIIKAPTQKD